MPHSSLCYWQPFLSKPTPRHLTMRNTVSKCRPSYFWNLRPRGTFSNHQLLHHYDCSWWHRQKNNDHTVFVSKMRRDRYIALAFKLGSILVMMERDVGRIETTSGNASNNVHNDLNMSSILEPQREVANFFWFICLDCGGVGHLEVAWRVLWSGLLRMGGREFAERL